MLRGGAHVHTSRRVTAWRRTQVQSHGQMLTRHGHGHGHRDMDMYILYMW